MLLEVDMQILTVDDDLEKVARIRSVIESVLDGLPGTLNLEVVATVSEAKARLADRQYDLMILDLNLPVREGESPRADAGLGLINLIRDNRRGLKPPTHILGLTAFDELQERYQKAFENELWHLVRYEANGVVWAEQLGRKLVHIFDATTAQSADGYLCDVAVVTALAPIELEAVLSLEASWKEVNLPGDDAIYFRGEFEWPGKRRTIVAAAAPEMGMPAAACLATKVIYSFRPRLLAMVGIAAGVKGNFGDILIADQVFDYGSGKIRTDGPGRKSRFLPAPSPIAIEPSLKSRLQVALLDGTRLREIREKWIGADSVPGDLRAYLGPMASGAAVLESKSLIAEIVGRNRKVIGVEMEAYGVLSAARICSEPRPRTLIVKSVCDFGDELKSDEYQSYAAFTSSRFLAMLIREHL